MLDLYEEFRALVGALEQHQAAYALCGGLAMAVYGVPRATVDVDLLVPPEGLAQVVAAAATRGFRLEEKPLLFGGGAVEIRRLVKADPATEDYLTLDLIVVTPALGPAWASRSTVAWEGGNLRVVSREDMIAMKLLRNSGQDQDDIARLRGVSDER
ncbi:MAG: nucleotidyl transferase AbiEii/AbiGii toxin family protein [Candidatus Latescibacteria bacterium]|nr:nucleotidyl transferase AbiEii/AbiGii toxin family protein [Candidatus Latescibacterota bacterium]